jgi:hypothetical protein
MDSNEKFKMIKNMDEKKEIKEKDIMDHDQSNIVGKAKQVLDLCKLVYLGYLWGFC